MLQVTVAPASRKRTNLELEKSSKVEDLRRLAKDTFGRPIFLALLTAEGHVPRDPAKSLEAAGVSDGDHLTAVVQYGKLAAASGAFALWSDEVTQLFPGAPTIAGAISKSKSKTILKV